MNGMDRKKFEGKRIFITGGTGFIGSHLIRKIVGLGGEVHALIRPGSDTFRIADCMDRIHTVGCDIKDPDLKKKVSKIEPEIVFHLAAYVNRERSFEVADKCMEVNMGGTLNLLKALQGVNFERLVNTGTCEEYGKIEAPFREECPLKPVSPYSVSKTAGVMLCETYNRIYGFPTVNLRPFLTYGPTQGRKMFIPDLILSCIRGRDFEMTGGKQGRDANYVDDIVEGYLRSAYVKKAIGEIINLGSGKESTIMEIAETINRLSGNPIKILAGRKPYREAEIWHLYCSNEKAKRLLDWSPSTGLEQGLSRTIDWYRQHFKGD